ncbi:MAG: beta-ketoacyl-ACP synthase II [Bacteroidota bacterium]
MELKRVVITGLGAVTPLGNDVNRFWQGLVSGANGAGPITHFKAEAFRTHFACEVKGFDPKDYFDRKEGRKMDRFTQYAMVAADECIADSGFEMGELSPHRVGVIWASGIGGFTTFENELIDYAANPANPRFNPFFITKVIPNMASGLISIKHGFMGINFTPVSACASGTNAIADAFNYIRLGKATAILSGGSEAAISQAAFGGFNAMRALSTRNDDPSKACRPFDKDRDGFVMGEGAGALFLEERAHALARGAKIYAEVVGCGFAADAYHISATHPEGLGAKWAMQDALDDAGLTVADVDYLNAHATSTPVGDISEAKAIADLFAGQLDQLHISATKSMTGHLLGGAGAIEGVASVLAIHHDQIPPTINLDNIDPELPEGLQLTPNKAVSKTVEVAMSNTFGFGGHNAIALFKKHR